ncbi:protein suppressor of hairy wing-like [Mercenaria mercenaria]|uniref:protein suppressor of hairy wing-like n=1 Tax=Mercenaria mercenaria TaxID=6596 RepID=UPI00234F5747|nr:protein suppressor of hairy wing-like [Mercenaria mercenaria]XP_053374467.1 protein suppressor of hairy wing-like [Mercenaria mercenaria]
METSEEKLDHGFDRRSQPADGEGDKPDLVSVITEDTSKSKWRDDIQSETTVNCNEDNQQVEMNEKTEKGNVATGSVKNVVKDVCPFVCGICSEKFDKVSVFYAHLKSHENFDVIAQMNKKNEMLEALDVQGKVNENVFKCGICQIEFPSMSLLHEHMVGEENISDYSYSNADHTARPASRVVLSQSDSDDDSNEVERVVRSPRNVRGRKRKTAEISTTATQTNKKSTVKGKVVGSKKTNTSSKKLVEQENLMQSRNGNKRKKEETSSLDDLSCSDSQKKRKMKNTDSENRVTLESSLEQTSVIKTYGTRGNLSPLTRSSRRISDRYANKRVDYKALAGLGSSKSDSEFEENSAPTKNISVESKEKKAGENDVEKRPKNSESMAKIVQEKKDPDKDSSGKDVEVIKENENKALPKKIKVVSMKNVETDKSNKEEELNLKNDIVTEKVNADKANYDSDMSDNDPVDSSDFEETEEIEIREDGDSAEEPAVKDDGTLVDVNSDSDTAIKVEIDSDYEYNASDDDSDDDFREEEALDDEENDPDFEPQSEIEYDNKGNVIVSLKNTRDPEEYLKKFKVKKKRISRKNKDGQPVKNCMYPCAICGRYYLWKALKKHMYAHVKVKAVQCTQCGKNYKSTRHLKDHIRSVHTMKKYGCPKCSSILKGNQSFEKHIMMHILKKEISEALDEVEKVEVSEEDYINWKTQQELLNGDSYYRKKKKKKETVPERQSKEEGIDLDLLKDGPLHGDHIVLEDDIVGTTKNQYCKICRRNFPTHESLVQHLLEHHDDEQFSCSICKGYFQTQEHLQNHMINVHGERELVCDICGERLRSTYALWAHKGKHLMKKDEYYSEEIVQKLQEEIAERKNKRKSNKSKTETKECVVCGMVVLAVRYKRHLEVHNTTKDWECEVCHNFYKTRRYLIDHMKKTHNAEKVSCDICGQAFKGKTYLEIHKQTHGPKDKPCPHCGKGFTTMMYLKTHLLTHEEKKRFRCNQCMAAFSHKQRLSIHMVEVHGEGASRPCKYCGDLFPSRQKARRHERIAHEGFVTPTRIKKKSNYYNIVKIHEPDNESLENKIVRLMPPGPSYVTVSPGVVKVPISKNTAVENSAKTSSEKNTVSTLPEVRSGAAGNGQFIKLGNGEEYQVMIEKDGNSESLEFVELTEEEQNVIIQEADGAISQSAPEMEEQDENVEQILEIPENAEQCQILLYPDGTFKLLNVVDNTNSD